MQTIYPEAQSAGGAYHLLNAIIAPRPIAWVSSRSAEGVPNLAPHSYTTVVSPSPPMVMFVSVGRKDTLTNIEATGDFVYNVGGADLVERINRTAADFPADISEYEWAGLTPLASERVGAPRVAEAPVQMEARLVNVVRAGETENYMVIGEVVAIHLDERIVRNDRVDTALLNPVGRLAGSGYAHLGEQFSLARPSWQSLQDEEATPMPPVSR